MKTTTNKIIKTTQQKTTMKIIIKATIKTTKNFNYNNDENED